jgi:NAD(P)-dependent dehydrogenase (short-subunit alcohol dehydrogenase family)
MMKAPQTDPESLQKMAAARLPPKRLGTPADVGACALYLASAAGSWVTGQTFRVAGGMLRAFPRGVRTSP